MPRLRLFALALFALITVPLHAQTQIPTLDLNTTWLVHPGPTGAQDPSFASPTLNDSTWTRITPADRIPNPAIDLWYRTHVTLPPGSHDLSLSLFADNLSDPGPFLGCPQFFVNGTFIGQGRGYPRCFETRSEFLQFPIPNQSLGVPDLVIAVHFTFRNNSRMLAYGGFLPHTHLLLAPSLQLENNRALFFYRDLSSNTVRVLIVLIVLVIVIALARSVPQPAEYHVLIVFLIADLAGNLLLCSTSLPGLDSRFSYSLIVIAENLFGLVNLLALTEFVRLVLGLRRSRLYLAYLALVSGYILVEIVVFQFHEISSAAAVRIQLVGLFTGLPIAALPILTLRAWRRRANPDALLLTVPLLLRSVVTIDTFWQQLTLALFHRTSTFLPLLPYVSWPEVFDIAFLITMLLFVVLRTVRIARARAALASELQAAQTVQQLLLNRSSLPTPGFHIDTVYLPASEVGGDFFLITPAPDGLIVIIGDVSGKGLTAAMRVAMILGALRRETSRSPSEILCNLNEAILTPNGGPPDLGFTTALCLHLTSTGQFTIANAGHISPYLNGLELQAPPALPLGLAPGQTYETLTGQLSAAQNLVLMTDGVPEARNPAGTLYGFEALSTLTQHPANEIAQTAQTFGQEDDITVLTLTLA